MLSGAIDQHPGQKYSQQAAGTSTNEQVVEMDGWLAGKSESQIFADGMRESK
jgi:hypothetical protein